MPYRISSADGAALYVCGAPHPHWLLLSASGNPPGPCTILMKKPYKAPGKGTGLGLAVCQEIVKGHGGRIAVSSQVGEGTCVWLWLPVEERGNYSGPAAATG